MKVTISPKYEYRPVTITLETECEFNGLVHSLTKYQASSAVYSPFGKIMKELLHQLGGVAR